MREPRSLRDVEKVLEMDCWDSVRPVWRLSRLRWLEPRRRVPRMVMQSWELDERWWRRVVIWDVSCVGDIWWLSFVS